MRIPTPRIGLAGILALLALGVLLLLAACGGGGEEKTGATATAEPKETATGKIDPCALITKAEAEAVLGEAVSEPKEETIGGVIESCTYYTVAVSTKYVSIVARTGISKEDFEAEANAAAGLLIADANSGVWRRRSGRFGTPHPLGAQGRCPAHGADADRHRFHSTRERGQGA